MDADAVRSMAETEDDDTGRTAMVVFWLWGIATGILTTSLPELLSLGTLAGPVARAIIIVAMFVFMGKYVYSALYPHGLEEATPE